jgi:hypothetical protein
MCFACLYSGPVFNGRIYTAQQTASAASQSKPLLRSLGLYRIQNDLLVVKGLEF